jgi:hypothetical protein
VSHFIEIGTAILLALPLFLASTLFFDLVHWALHRMLRSRFRLLRGLAWPHSVHHAWLDAHLEIRWENQRRNIWCHLVLEYLTQVTFSGLLLIVVPQRFVVATLVLQTLVFALLLRERGLDLNHRPIAMLDAYPPMFLCPPTYHALHHVYPDAYFSAYLKLVDYVVGSGAWLRGRRFLMHRPGASAFGRALRDRLQSEIGAEVPEVAEPDEASLASTDVLVLCDASVEVRLVEAYVRATRTRKLPPEVWCVHREPVDATARHYYRDVRVTYRTLVVPHAADERLARSAARIALFFLRRGFNYVPTTLGLSAIAGFWRFRRTAAARPEGAPRVRSRAELAAAA